MKSRLFDDVPKSVKLSTEKWLYIFPDNGKGYELYDPLAEEEMGHILFDDDGYWIYDGKFLSIDEQEEAAGKISGYQKEMNALVNSLKSDKPWQI